MKRKVPLKVYLQVAVGFFFILLIIWYFLCRLLFPLLLQHFSLETAAYITFTLSFCICCFLVRPSIQKELKRSDEPFSIVARDPKVTIKHEKITLRIIFLKSAASMLLSCVFSLPLTLIIIFRFIAVPDRNIDVFLGLLNEYTGFYVFFLGASLFSIFIFVPSLRKWHWTKHQF